MLEGFYIISVLVFMCTAYGLYSILNEHIFKPLDKDTSTSIFTDTYKDTYKNTEA